jgi:hypothetical protein
MWMTTAYIINPAMMTTLSIVLFLLHKMIEEAIRWMRYSSTRLRQPVLQFTVVQII